MNIIKKYNISFIEMKEMSIITKLGIKLFLLMSIFKVELLYYRSNTEIFRILTTIFGITILFLIDINNIVFIQTLLLLIFINNDIIFLLLLPHVIIITDQDSTKLLHISVNVNDKNNAISLKGMHKDKIVFFIKASTIDPKISMMLLNEYLENKNLAEYKQQFIKNNLEIELFKDDMSEFEHYYHPWTQN